MELKISNEEGSIVFDLGERPTPVSLLVVADEHEEELWEIHSAPSEPGPPGENVFPHVDDGEFEATFFAVRVPRTVLDLLKKVPSLEDTTQYPLLTRVVYGELPAGYHELVRPRALTPGQTYCVSIFGNGFDTAAAFFTA